MQKKEPTARTETSKSTEINLPIDRRDLGEFIKGLLGQPRSIEKVFRDPFVISAGVIQNIDNILDQRVAGQHEAHLTDFTAEIFFSDGRIHHLKTRDALQAYRDLSESPSVGFVIVWTYLVQFHNRALPEKQEITLSAFCDINKVDETGIRKLRAQPSTFYSMLEGGNPRVIIRVEYTELTWGYDIMNYLDGEVSRTVRRPNSTIEILRLIVLIFVIPLAPLILLGGPILWRNYEVGVINEMLGDKVKQQMSTATDAIAQLQLKLDYLVLQHSTPAWFSARYTLLVSGTIVVFAVIASFILSTPKSFIILNDKAQSNYNDWRSRNNNRITLQIGGLVMAIVASVIANKLTPLVGW